VFVTANTFTATSTNIADYNTDVNNDANNLGGDLGSLLVSLDATWTDIGSTSATNAIANIGIDSGVPIYNLAGNLVAADAGTESGGLFGSGAVQSPIDVTETGSVIGVLVWTGTSPSGTAEPGDALGSDEPEEGLSQASAGSSQWIAATNGGSGPFQLFAISGILTAPAPESTVTLLTALGGAVLLAAMRRRTRTRPALRDR
jgi:hypothetical protein